MPIYRYECKDCGVAADYLVRKAGQTPDGCERCDSDDLTRILHGQTFSTVTESVRMTEEGKFKEGIPTDQQTQTIDDKTQLEPGIYVSSGVSEDGKQLINVSRVQDDGKVDASVTGSKTLN